MHHLIRIVIVADVRFYRDGLSDIIARHPRCSVLGTASNRADAVDRVPGRVLVVGHTDDQPLRSLRYRDNYDLSRERAVSVVKVLQPAMDNPARVEWTGVGSSQPRFRPESAAANRARNRRVQFIIQERSP